MSNNICLVIKFIIFNIYTVGSLKDDITRNLLLLLAVSMEMYHMWLEASVVEMRENHNVYVFKELLMAGDVELNPGPYPPGISKF